MKILIIGLDGAISEQLFSDERLENIRRLMEYGCYGKLSYEVTSDRFGIWMSLVTSQDPGSLGEAQTEDQKANQGIAIWEQMEEQNKGVIVVGLPPFISYPLEIETRVNKLLLDMRLMGENLTARDADLLKNHIYAVSHKQLDLVRFLMQSEDWVYFQFVDDGLYQLQRKGLINSESHSKDLLTDYYLYLDEQIGTVLELLDDSTVVLVVLLGGTKPFDGSFILASSNNPLEGEVEGAYLLDLAPTLLELCGYELPASMQGKSLVDRKTLESGSDVDLSAEEEEILRERLSGLGYIS